MDNMSGILEQTKNALQALPYHLAEQSFSRDWHNMENAIKRDNATGRMGYGTCGGYSEASDMKKFNEDQISTAHTQKKADYLLEQLNPCEMETFIKLMKTEMEGFFEHNAETPEEFSNEPYYMKSKEERLKFMQQRLQHLKNTSSYLYRGLTYCLNNTSYDDLDDIIEYITGHRPLKLNKKDASNNVGTMKSFSMQSC